MTPIEQYIATLTQLTGDDFEDEVASRLQIAISDFQPIVSKPNGDGGLDGASDDYTIGYCCYGPEYDSFENEKEINADIIDKFKSDLRRILELGADDDANVFPEHPAPNSPKGKTATLTAPADAQSAKSQAPVSKMKPKSGELKHRENKALFDIIPTGKKLKNIKLIVNRYESNKVLKPLNDALRQYKAKSQKRFVEDTVTITVRGPKELANQHAVDELTLNRARLRRNTAKIEQAAANVILKDVRDFEHKVILLKKLRPSHEAQIDTLAEKWRAGWRLALACEEDLHSTSPDLHYALEQSRIGLLNRIDALMLESEEGWKELSKAMEIATEILQKTFHPVYGDMFPRVCHAEVSRLIGDCPIRWEAPNG